MDTEGFPAVADLIGEHRGPCAFCGDDDARHRVLDAIQERVKAGEPAADVADDYGLSLTHTLRIVEEN